MAYRRCLPALRSRTSPTSRSTRRCLDAPGWVIPSSWANSVTGRSPARSRTRMSRRCGSAIALKTSDVVAARAMGAIICRYRHASSQRNSGGSCRKTIAPAEPPGSARRPAAVEHPLRTAPLEALSGGATDEGRALNDFGANSSGPVAPSPLPGAQRGPLLQLCWGRWREAPDGVWPAAATVDWIARPSVRAFIGPSLLSAPHPVLRATFLAPRRRRREAAKRPGEARRRNPMSSCPTGRASVACARPRRGRARGPNCAACAFRSCASRSTDAPDEDGRPPGRLSLPSLQATIERSAPRGRRRR